MQEKLKVFADFKTGEVRFVLAEKFPAASYRWMNQEAELAQFVDITQGTKERSWE